MFDGFTQLDLNNEKHVDITLWHIARLYAKTTSNLKRQYPSRSDFETPCFNRDILIDALSRYQGDLRKNSDKPNEFKQGGYLTFWIKKLKPFRHFKLFDDKQGLLTNEILALAFGVSTVGQHAPLQRILRAIKPDSRVWNELIYDLRYRPMSGHQLTKIFEFAALSSADLASK